MRLLSQLAFFLKTPRYPVKELREMKQQVRRINTALNGSQNPEEVIRAVLDALQSTKKNGN